MTRTFNSAQSQIHRPTSIEQLPQPAIEKINLFLSIKGLPIFKRSLLQHMAQEDFEKEVKSEDGFIFRGKINNPPKLCASCKYLDKNYLALNLLSHHNNSIEVLLLNEEFEPVDLCLKHYTRVK